MSISEWILKMAGWRFEGKENVRNLKKFVVAVVPHTSNWDFPLGLLTRAISGHRTKFVGKSSLFRFPFGWVFSALGGVPVDRSKSNNFVDAVVDIYNQNDSLSVCIAPEGTRKRVDKLKTGFYYIAAGAKVPIILCKFDYEHKLVTYSKPFYPTGNAEEDMAKITAYFSGVKGKIAENSFYAPWADAKQ